MEHIKRAIAQIVVIFTTLLWGPIILTQGIIGAIRNELRKLGITDEHIEQLFNSIPY
jgi:hypothetical protein